jgi:hypothetical protein
MAAAKKKPTKAVKARMRWNGRIGKMVKVDPARSARAKKALSHLRGKKRKFKNNALRIKNIKKAFKTGKNIHGHKVRKWGRPKGSKDSAPRKERSDKGKARGPRKGKRQSKAARKRESVGMKKAMGGKTQSKAARKRESVGMKKVMDAPRRGRPPGSKNKVKVAEAPRRGRPPGSTNKAKAPARPNLPKKRKG